MVHSDNYYPQYTPEPLSHVTHLQVLNLKNTNASRLPDNVLEMAEENIPTFAYKEEHNGHSFGRGTEDLADMVLHDFITCY